MSGSEEDRDALAGEYVLGTLDALAADHVAARIAADPAWRDAVEDWQRRLAPLADTAAPVAPPAGLWDRLARSTGRTAGRETLWRRTALGSLALAAGLAAFLVLREPARPIAALVPAGGEPATFVAWRGTGGGLLLRPLAPVSVPQGRDLELWALPQGATRPVALGVLPAQGGRVGMTPHGPARLLVSLEPRGGSPTGQPTGPVLYAGSLSGS